MEFAVPEKTGLTLYNNVLKISGSSRSIIRIDLKEAGRLTITIYAAQGREITTIFDGHMPAGTHTFAWDGTDAEGGKLGSGIYIVQMESGKFSNTKKIAVVK